MTINFAFLALDAIVNHAAKIRYMFDGQFTVPLVIRAASGWGDQATASHSHAPEPIFAHFPGLYVAAPATPGDAYGMLKTAIRDENPVLFSESIAPVSQTRAGARRRGTIWCRSGRAPSAARART